MKMTLTYSDLLEAAQAHLRKMGVVGEVTDVELKVGRKDRTKTTMTITVGASETKEAHPDTIQRVVQNEKPEITQDMAEEKPETCQDGADQSTPEEKPKIVSAGSSLFKGISQS